MKWLIFTDLDGTLLCHDTYKSDAAHATIEALQALGIPIVFVTSKTRVEVEKLQKELSIHDPFIVENGAAVFIPIGYRGFNLMAYPVREGYHVIELGASYDDVRAFLRRMQESFHIRGFGDMSELEVAGLISQPRHQVKDAMQREYTEPFIVKKPGDEAAIARAADEHALSITRGGRFFHIMSEAQDKGVAVKKLVDIFHTNGCFPMTISLGDSKNDIAMFKATDKAILIRKTDGSYEPVDVENIIKAPEHGPQGWAASLKKVIDGLEV